MTTDRARLGVILAAAAGFFDILLVTLVNTLTGPLGAAQN
jgi:hypothetical protein